MSSYGEFKMEISTAIEGTEVENVDFSLFRGCVLRGRWDYVISAYRNNIEFHKRNINASRGTALHVAVNGGNVELVYDLVDAILGHEGREVLRRDSALRSTNERGDTPLHLAASRGFTGMCKCIIGESGERKDLIRVKNNKGETPLFRAVLTCHKKTFVYLHNVSKNFSVSLRNNDGDTILHGAIWGELFDLAIIITHCYPELVNARNKDGITPLEVLASKPSAFKSGSSLSWWKQIQYFCIPVGPLDAEKSIILYMAKIGKSEDREFKEVTNEAKKARTVKKAHTFVERKYATSVRFAKNVVLVVFKGLRLLGLGTLQDFKAIMEIKRKHKWSHQLFDVFMKTHFKLYIENTGNQPFDKYDKKEDIDIATTWEAFITQQPLEVVGDDSSWQKPQEKETAFLAAAKNGIVDIVFALQSEMPSVLHETNSYNQNVLLVAVKNRQTNVVEVLRKNFDQDLFDSLILEVDNMDNTALHLAADSTSNSERTWQIAGAAMQIMLDIKWYQYIRDLVPEHFTYKKNKDDKTALEIFKQNHKDLLKQSSEWLKETSNSCSAVAALVAGVSFAASSTVPGGAEKGKPSLEGQPAFDAFAITTLIALCFSVTALIMFLAIFTSEKQLEDFRKSLPLKLLVGLSSLFVSIASMIVSFCIAHFFVLKDKYKNKLFPLYIATCFPVIFYAIVQFPLYFNLLKAILMKVPQPSIKSSHF